MWTYAMGHRVVRGRADVYAGERLLRTELRAVGSGRKPCAGGGPLLLNSPFDHPGPAALAAHFATSGYEPFAKAEARIPTLRKLIDLLGIARQAGFMEIRAATVCVAMEMLRYSQGEFMVREGRAVRDGSTFRRVGGPRGRSRLGFRALMEELARELELTHWNPALVSFRNDVFHTGELPGSNHQERRSALNAAIHFCDTVVLALLDWDRAGGHYRPEHRPGEFTDTKSSVNIEPFVR